MVIEPHFSDFGRRDWERTPVDGTVRFAILGLGAFVRDRALPAIEETDSCSVGILVSSTPDEARELAEMYEATAVIDYDAFLAGEHADAYDAIYIGLPNALHDEYAIAAADREKHVLCEKPLSVSADRARQIRDACTEADVTLMTAYRLQLEPTVRRTRELVQADVIGDVHQIHGSFTNPLFSYTTPDSWRLDPTLSGGGALMDLGIYPLNTSRFILEDDPTEVVAMTYSSGPPYDEVDEHVAFQLRFPSGATASCSASFDAHPHSQLQLVGTDGFITIEAPFAGVVPHNIVVESGEVHVEHTGQPIDEVREEFAYFAYCVLTGTRPEPDGDDGVADLDVIEAAYRSAEDGHCVELSIGSTDT